MEECRYNAFEFNCYFSAYVSAARSFTWAIKKHLSGVPGFEDFWDELVKGKLKNQTSRKFVKIRNLIEKEAENEIVGGSVAKKGKEVQVIYHFKNEKEKDVIGWCKEYFQILKKVHSLIVNRFRLNDPSSECYWQDILGLGDPV